MTKLVFTATVLLAGTLALASCGRKGPLELPPENPSQQAAQQKNAGDQSSPDIQIAPDDKPIVLDGSGRSIELGPDAVGQNAGDDDSFFLDALIQ